MKLAIDATTKVINPSTSYTSGQTYLLTTDGDTEQVYITNVDSGTNTVTFERGVNGTTAIAHTTATVQRAKYPPELIAIVNHAVSRNYKLRQRVGLKEEDMDDLNLIFDEEATLNVAERKACKQAQLRRMWF